MKDTLKVLTIMSTRNDFYQKVKTAINEDNTKTYKDALNGCDTETQIVLWNYTMLETGQLNYIHNFDDHTISRINEFCQQEYVEDCFDYVENVKDSPTNPDIVADYFLSNFGEHDGVGIYQHRCTKDGVDTYQFDNLIKVKQFLSKEDYILDFVNVDLLSAFLKIKNITPDDVKRPNFKETITASYEQACLDNAIKWHFNEESPECTPTTNDVVIHFNPHQVSDVSTDTSEIAFGFAGDADFFVSRDNLTGQIEGDAIIELRVVREGLPDYEMAYMISVPFTGNIVKGWSHTDLDDESNLTDIVNNDEGHAIEAIQVAFVSFDLNQIKTIKKANVEYEDGITYSNEEDGFHFATGTNRNEDVQYKKLQELNLNELNSINQFIEGIKQADPLHLAHHATFMTINSMIDHPMLDRINTRRCLQQVSQHVLEIEKDVVLKQTNTMSYNPTN